MKPTTGHPSDASADHPPPTSSRWRAVGDGELGDVEADGPDWWSADGDLSGEGFLDAVVGPSTGESLTFVRQCLDKLCETGLGGVLGGGAELAEEPVATFFPADIHTGRGVLGEVEPHQAASTGGECVWRPDGREGDASSSRRSPGVLCHGNRVEVTVGPIGVAADEGFGLPPNRLRRDSMVACKSRGDRSRSRAACGRLASPAPRCV